MTPILLTKVPPGTRVLVDTIGGDPRRIEKLASLGILPGVEMRVDQVRPVVVVACGETVIALERALADTIEVHTAPDEDVKTHR